MPLVIVLNSHNAWFFALVAPAGRALPSDALFIHRLLCTMPRLQARASRPDGMSYTLYTLYN